MSETVNTRPQGVKTRAALLSVYSGRECIGFLLNRGPAGIEGFTANEISLGTFPTDAAAADAVWAHAQPSDQGGGR